MRSARRGVVAAMEDNTLPHSHSISTCPECGGVTTCKCIGKTKENTTVTTDLCHCCKGKTSDVVSTEDVISEPNVKTEQVEIEPSSVVNPETITNEPVINTSSQEEVIRSQMEAEGLNIDSAADKFAGDMDSFGEDQKALDNVNKEIDDTMRVKEALESIADIVSKTPIATPIGVEMVNTTVGILSRSVGIKKRPQFSLESFKTSSELALEDFAETAKKIWNKIIEYIGKAIEFVKEFFAKIFMSASTLKKQAADLKTQIKETTIVPKEKTFKNTGFSDSLSIGGKIPDNFISPLHTFEQVAKNTFNASITTGVKMGHILEGLYAEKNGALLYDIRAFMHLPKDEHSSGTVVKGDDMPSKFSSEKFHSYSNLSVVRSEELFGNKALYITRRDVDTQGLMALIALDYTESGIYPFNLKQKESDTEEVKILDPRQMEYIVDSVDRVLSDLITYKEEAKKLANIKLRFKLIGMNVSNNNYGVGNQQTVHDNQRLLRLIPRLMDHPGVDMASYTMHTCRHLLSYVKESLKYYETAKETKIIKESNESKSELTHA